MMTHILNKGDRVIAKYPGYRGRTDGEEKVFFAATVTGLNVDGTVSVKFADGDHGNDLTSTEMFFAPEAAADVGQGGSVFGRYADVAKLSEYFKCTPVVVASTTSVRSSDGMHELKEEDCVIAKYPNYRSHPQEKHVFFTANVTGINATNGTAEVMYLDGDEAGGLLPSEVFFCPDGAPVDVGKSSFALGRHASAEEMRNMFACVAVTITTVVQRAAEAQAQAEAHAAAQAAAQADAARVEAEKAEAQAAEEQRAAAQASAQAEAQAQAAANAEVAAQKEKEEMARVAREAQVAEEAQRAAEEEARVARAAQEADEARRAGILRREAEKVAEALAQAQAAAQAVAQAEAVRVETERRVAHEEFEIARAAEKAEAARAAAAAAAEADAVAAAQEEKRAEEKRAEEKAAAARVAAEKQATADEVARKEAESTRLERERKADVAAQVEAARVAAEERREAEERAVEEVAAAKKAREEAEAAKQQAETNRLAAKAAAKREKKVAEEKARKEKQRARREANAAAAAARNAAAAQIEIDREESLFSFLWGTKVTINFDEFQRAHYPGDLLVGSQKFKEIHDDFVFQALDSDGDGHIDETELPLALIKALDSDGDHKLTKGEMSMERALALFDAWDTNGDGFLDRDEMPQAIIDVAERLSANPPTPSDGVLSFAEFEAAYTVPDELPVAPSTKTAEAVLHLRETLADHPLDSEEGASAVAAAVAAAKEQKKAAEIEKTNPIVDDPIIYYAYWDDEL